jgi:hypothetical protein
MLGWRLVQLGMSYMRQYTQLRIHRACTSVQSLNLQGR